MKLLIISNMAHYRASGRVHGWGPAVREIDHLAEVFDEVRHLAALHPGPPPPTSLAYASPKICFLPLPRSGGRGFFAKLGILWCTPRYLAACFRELRRADAVHVRCPANISLEALLLLRFMKRPKIRWVKYAGNWRPHERDPFFYRLQRRWLERGTHKGFVTINGEWPNQPPHVISCHNPCFTAGELDDAARLTRDKQLGEPLRLLFAGRLRRSKGAERALRILDELRNRGLNARLDVAGDGPEALKLAELTWRLGLTASVKFHGWLPRTALDKLYHQAHFLLLPSSTEGWPKVLAEAMAFRAVPLAAAVSCIPQILEHAGAGTALPVDAAAGFAGEIERIALSPGLWSRMASNGQRAASEFTYEAYVERVRQLLQIEHSPSKKQSAAAAA